MLCYGLTQRHLSHLEDIARPPQCPTLRSENLVGIEQGRLILSLSNLLVLTLKPISHSPSTGSTGNAKSRARRHGHDIARFVRLGPHVGCPDEGCDGKTVDNGERTCLLLSCLGAGVGDPAENDTVDGVGSDGENAHGDCNIRQLEGSRMGKGFIYSIVHLC